MIKNFHPSPLGLLKTSVHHLYRNPILAFPAITLAFIQLLTLEILYFAPRYPFSEFFGPLIRNVWSEDFLHYPQDLVLLPKMFYYAQVLISVFIGSFLMAVTVRMVLILNDHPRIHLKSALKETSKVYVHILCASVLSLFLFQCVSSVYAALLSVLSDSKVSWIPPESLTSVSAGESYIQLLVSTFLTIFLIFVIPIIVIEKKKLFPAITLNFKVLSRAFRTTALIVFVPTLFYLPILAARNNIESLISTTIPDVQILIIVVGIFVTIAIDLIIVTAIATYYLFIKENYEKNR